MGSLVLSREPPEGIQGPTSPNSSVPERSMFPGEGLHIHIVHLELITPRVMLLPQYILLILGQCRVYIKKRTFSLPFLSSFALETNKNNKNL